MTSTEAPLLDFRGFTIAGIIDRSCALCDMCEHWLKFYVEETGFEPAITRVTTERSTLELLPVPYRGFEASLTGRVSEFLTLSPAPAFPHANGSPPRRTSSATSP